MRVYLPILGIGLLGLSTVVRADIDADVCPVDDICELQSSLVDLMLEIPDIREFCQQLDPEDESIAPVTVIVTELVHPSTTVDTIYHTFTRTVQKYVTTPVTVSKSIGITVTDTSSSIAVQTVDVTTQLTDVKTTTLTATQTFTNTVLATTTDTVVITDINTSTVYTTATVTVTAQATSNSAKRDSKDVPEPLRQYSVQDLQEACSCLPVSTVSTTVTIPQPTQTRTVVIPTTVTETDTAAITSVVVDTIFHTATTDVITVITVSSTETITATTTIQTTVSTTVDQTVDITLTETATATITDNESATVTEAVTVTVTATPTATCGVNLIQNPVFQSLTLPPWTKTVTGTFNQMYNSNCGVSPYCLLIYGPGAGSFSLSQTIDTVAGQQYTMSFDYHTWAVPSAGTTFTCQVSNADSTTWSIPLSVSTSAWHTFSGTFVASGASTTFTCAGSTASSLVLNLSVFDIQC
ncbi:hypothetical protein P175DRAFT_0500172 [Aspergillus ochraceoroseus IBT 24754]|uniref:CBM-cenC domain-containing protein n=1 Tax=Aspergillus ochraceoroseus IBT 24754 TaxID=1392256 RepID=A0A2T5M4Z2_9EURO|nr:uncharacterized protein P175DRAFT_0500172 [Aspergillus ochraceoroseus IBT 24754]PTU23611.1 hypothetical protein P175DRAFT_0500172 [Aspergillus ochraceoroseus IBT 24754]